MHDKVPYDIYVNDPVPFRMSEKPHTEARESIDCMEDILVGQQVIIICSSRVKPQDSWTGAVYAKYKNKKASLYNKDRKLNVEAGCDPWSRKFKAEWHTVTSDRPNKKLRTNLHLVIERIK